MSIPDNLTEFEEKLYDWAMKCPLLKEGDEIIEYDLESQTKYTLLEDSEAHGCPWVRTEEGDEFCKTMNHHHYIFEMLKQLRVRISGQKSIRREVLKQRQILGLPLE